VDNDPPSPASDIDDFWATSYAQCNLNSMYLLIHKGYCDADQFRCPSDGDYIEFDPNGDDAGFNQWNNSSYAFQPFTRGTDANPNNAYPGAPSQDGGTIIAGDRPNTGGSDLKASGNHTGGSYLTMNNAVNFINQEEPTFGYNSNNVYEVDMDADGDVTSQSGLPVYASDTYLVWKSGS
jgi:hypothetical protein